jgi:ABC-type branched-subunit amino acid transport system substrate-binding protein
MHCRTPLFVLTGLAVLLILNACAVGGPGRRATDEERLAYDTALANLPQDPAAAVAGLESFLRVHPESPLLGQAAENLAKIAYDQGRIDDVFRWLYYAERQDPTGPRADAIRLRLARLEFDRGVVDAARELAPRIRESRLTDRERKALYRLLADLAETPVGRLAHLAELRALIANDVEATSAAPDSSQGLLARTLLRSADEQIDRLLESLTLEELRVASGALQGRPPAARVRLQLASRLLEDGERERAEELVEVAKRHDLTPADEERIAALEIRLGMGDAASFLPTFREVAERGMPDLSDAEGTIGVVLPLSGRFGTYGMEALRGVLLAAGVFDSLPPDPAPGDYTDETDETEGGAGPAAPARAGAFQLAPDGGELRLGPSVRLLVRDSAGRPEQAAAAVRELAEDDDVVAIVGPIGSSECEAAAREAERAKIPLLTLSNRQEIPTDREYVFRLRTTIQDEVGFLVDYAFDELGAENFAVLYPKSRYGRGMREQYWNAVLERGGRMVAVASYPPDATDFNDAIRSMIGYGLLTRDEKTALAERARMLRRARRLEPEDQALARQIVYPLVGPELAVLPPTVDFDALFIPDSHDKIALIAPQLAFHEIGKMQLLGSSDWNDPQLVKIARKHVRGAVISTPFFEGSAYDFVRHFRSTYEDSFGVSPDTFSAYGYDAANLVLVQLARIDEGDDTRRQVREGILETRGYPGVSGVMSMLPDGNARKRPFLLGVQRGRIVGLD